MSSETLVRCAVAVAALLLILGCRPATVPPERIVLIVVDTLRLDHISGRHWAETPHIDGLAARGQVFQNAVASFHQTSMSMSSLFTGRTPSLESGQVESPMGMNGRTWCGLRRLVEKPGDESCIPESLPTLAQSFREADYWTAGVVTNGLLFRPLGYDRGFDEWVQVSGDQTARIAALFRGNYRTRAAGPANEAVERLLDARPEDRFFLYVHYMDTHDYRLAGRSYPASVSVTDEAIGRLLEMLQERDLLEEAVVVLVADHGERLSEKHLVPGRPTHGGNPSFEEVLRIPLIISPAVVDEPEGLLRSDDIHRMIQRIAGIETRDSPDLEPGELFVSEQTYQTYRQGSWKSFRDRAGRKLRLIDLAADPGETRDVAAEHAEIAAEHVRRMDELSRTLAAVNKPGTRLTPDDEQRLRSLGYLD